MDYQCENVKLRPSNIKQSQFNAGNDKENPRIVITLNEAHLAKWTESKKGKYPKKIKSVGIFKTSTGEVIEELPIKIWITPKNTLYQLLNTNKTLDGWFRLVIKKSWGTFNVSLCKTFCNKSFLGSFYDVIDWKMNERLDESLKIIAPPSSSESLESKLTRIADSGLKRIFELHPGFLHKVEQWYRSQNNAPAVRMIVNELYPMSSRHQIIVQRLQNAQKSEVQMEQLKSEIQPTLVTIKVLEYITKWQHVSILCHFEKNFPHLFLRLHS